MIQKLREKFLRGHELTRDDVTIAVASLDSVEPRERLIACQALFIGPSTPIQKGKALTVLAEASREVSTGAVAPSLTFLNTLDLVPIKALLDEVNDVMPTLARAMESPVFDIRLGSVPTLARLAKLGHGEAKLLLSAAEKDENEYVRAAAAAANQ